MTTASPPLSLGWTEEGAEEMEVSVDEVEVSGPQADPRTAPAVSPLLLRLAVLSRLTTVQLSVQIRM